MPAPLPTDTLLDAALVKIGAATWGVTRGGVRRTPGRELRPVEFDGRRATHIVGLDRIVDFGERAEFTMIELGQVNIDRFEHVSGGAPARPKAGEIYTAARYLTDVSLTYRRAGGGSVVVRYPSALVQWTEIRGEDKGEAELAVAVEPRLTGVDLDLAPYDLQILSADAGASLSERLPQTGLLNVWYPDTGTGQSLEDKKSARNMELGSDPGADTNDPSWGTSPASLRYVGDDWASVLDLGATDTPADYTHIVVLRPNVMDAVTRYFYGYGHALELAMAIVDMGATKDWRVYNGTAFADGGAFAAGTWYALYAIRSSASGNITKYMNNTHVGTGAYGASPVQATPKAVLGNFAPGVGGVLDSDIGVVIRYNRAISFGAASERIDIQDILRDFYPALPAGA